MASQYRLPLHLWIASPCCFVLGLLAIAHGVILNGLCVFLVGAGGLLAIARRNEPGVGLLDKIALACFGGSALLLMAVVVRGVTAGQP